MSDVIVLNAGLNARPTKSGKQRVSVTIKSEPLIFDLDTRKLVQPVAEALAHHLREKMRGIAAMATPATIRAREVARRALQRGEQWAVKRYGGGRMGVREPGQSDRLFNDSGRFAESIVAAAAKDGTFRVNVATNRLDPNTLNGGLAALEKMWARLVQLVPEFQDIGRAMQSDDVLRARVKAARDIVRKAQFGQTVKAAVDLLKTALDTVETLTG